MRFGTMWTRRAHVSIHAWARRVKEPYLTGRDGPPLPTLRGRRGQSTVFWQMNRALSAMPPMRGMAPRTASRPESFTATFGFFSSR